MDLDDVHGLREIEAEAYSYFNGQFHGNKIWTGWVLILSPYFNFYWFKETYYLYIFLVISNYLLAWGSQVNEKLHFVICNFRSFGFSLTFWCSSSSVVHGIGVTFIQPSDYSSFFSRDCVYGYPDDFERWVTFIYFNILVIC